MTQHLDAPEASTPAPQTGQRRINAWREKLRKKPAPAAPVRPARGGWGIAAIAALGALVLVIVAVGLRVGLGALRDAALANHVDPEAAELYWIGVDGLIVVAIIAALVLRNQPGARRYCLTVVALFTLASGALQYLHGLGWFTPGGVDRDALRLPDGVRLLIATLIIATTFCGTHLLVYVLRHLFPGSPVELPEPSSAATPQAPIEGDDEEAPNHPSAGGQLDPDVEKEVRKWFAAIAVGMLLDADVKPVRSRLAREFGIAPRQVGYVIADVTRIREEAAEQKRAEEEKARALALSPDPEHGFGLADSVEFAGASALNGAAHR